MYIERIAQLQLSAQTTPLVELPIAQNRYIPFGSDNLFPNQLLHYANLSTTHKAILQMKTQLYAGDGWQSATDLPTWCNQELLQRISNDYATFGGFALQVIWSKNGETIAQVKPIAFSKLRSGVPDNKGEIGFWYYSPNWKVWESQATTYSRPVPMAVFNPTLAQRYPRQILVVQRYTPEQDFYPLPVYMSAIPDMQFEFEYAQFRLHSMQNGMFPSLHIEVEGLPSEEERQAFYEALKKKFSGSPKAGEVLITYGYEGSGRTKITPIQVGGNADLFREWAADATQRIITAHGLTSPAMIGLPAKAGLSASGQELNAAFEQFQQVQVKPVQQVLVGAMQELIQYTPQSKAKTDLSISNLKPIRQVFAEGLLREILSTNELRNEIGYPPQSPSN